MKYIRESLCVCVCVFARLLSLSVMKKIIMIAFDIAILKATLNVN